METISVESSSDEDDTYLNSVAKLKALRKRVNEPDHGPVKNGVPTVNETPLANESPVVEVVSVTHQQRSRKRNTATRASRRRQRKQQQQESADSDLEIVSVEEFSRTLEPTGNEGERGVEGGGEERAQNSSLLSEEENYETNVKVLWRSKDLHRLNVHRNESFERIYQHFARLAGVSSEEILITRREKTVSRTDTPASIGLSVIDILEGGVVKGSGGSQNGRKEESARTCTIRVQGASKRATFSISVPMDETLHELARICSERLDVDEKRVRFFFDGEIVDLEETPDSLEIEDEACFDLKIVS